MPEAIAPGSTVPRPLRLPVFDDAERAHIDAERLASRPPGFDDPQRWREHVQESLRDGARVDPSQLFRALPFDAAAAHFWAKDPAQAFYGPDTPTLRFLIARFGERLLPFLDEWAYHSAPELMAEMGSVRAAAHLVARLASHEPAIADEARRWMSSHLEQATEGVCEQGWDLRIAAGVEARRWLAERPEQVAAPLVARALEVGEAATAGSLSAGSPARTLRWYARRFGPDRLLAACPETERARLDALLDPTRDAYVKDAPFRSTKWWPRVVDDAATRAVLEQGLLPHHPDAIALREALGASATPLAHAIVDAFVEDKAKPQNRATLTAAMVLDPEAVVRRISRLCVGWSKASNRNHRNLVIHVIDALRWVPSDEAIARLALLSETLGQPDRREEARRALAELALERGVDPDELVSGCLPDLGLESDGSLHLDFGPRAFVVRFDAEGKPRVFDDAGAPRANLPKPGKKDDPERAALAVRRFDEVRRDLKHLIAAESARLEHALAVGRRWPLPPLLEEARHPVRRTLFTALVFETCERDVDDARPVVRFRVSEGTEIRNAEDERLELEPDRWARLVHPLDLAPEERARWQLALADYELVPPFLQLDRPTFDAEVVDGRLETCAEWSSHAGSLLGMLRRGWSGRWASSDLLAGIERRIGGGIARLEWEPFSTSAIAQVGEVAFGPLYLAGVTPTRRLVSELLFELHRMRRLDSI